MNKVTKVMLLSGLVLIIAATVVAKVDSSSTLSDVATAALLGSLLTILVGSLVAIRQWRKGEPERLAKLKAQWFCTNCEEHSVPCRPLRGSGWITFFLSFLGFVPGVVYFVWRRTGPKNCCSTCHQEMLPATTRKAQRLKAAITQ